MAYISRDIKDRVAVGDNIFTVEEMGNDVIKLTPNPTSVTEVGTAVNKALLQLMEDRIVWLMNHVFNDITANPFVISFESLDGLTVTGVWNTSLERIEC